MSCSNIYSTTPRSTLLIRIIIILIYDDDDDVGRIIIYEQKEGEFVVEDNNTSINLINLYFPDILYLCSKLPAADKRNRLSVKINSVGVVRARYAIEWHIEFVTCNGDVLAPAHTLLFRHSAGRTTYARIYGGSSNQVCIFPLGTFRAVICAGAFVAVSKPSQGAAHTAGR